MIMKHIFNYIFFSTLNNVIGKKTNCLNVNKFSLLQTVKFDLQSKESIFCQLVQRRDFLRFPIDYKLSKKMIWSKKVYNEGLDIL